MRKLKNAFHDLEGDVMRSAILDGRRSDGRAHDEIRDIFIVPRSSIFSNHTTACSGRTPTVMTVPPVQPALPQSQ